MSEIYRNDLFEIPKTKSDELLAFRFPPTEPATEMITNELQPSFIVFLCIQRWMEYKKLEAAKVWKESVCWLEVKFFLSVYMAPENTTFSITVHFKEKTQSRFLIKYKAKLYYYYYLKRKLYICIFVSYINYTP